MATVKKAQNGRLTKAEMDALSHQKRGMGNSAVTSFVKKAGPIKNETGILTSTQKKQLDAYMSKAGTAKKIYEGLPNIGRMVGKSAADIPKGSQLEKQRKGGSTAKAKDGKWIQKAVNPKHKGYCTPMTKATCTPKRKALAKTFKALGRARKGK